MSVDFSSFPALALVQGHLRVAHRFAVPARNNASERAIRGVQVNQKTSGTRCTLETLRTSMRLRSYLATTDS